MRTRALYSSLAAATASRTALTTSSRGTDASRGRTLSLSSSVLTLGKARRGSLTVEASLEWCLPVHAAAW